MAFDINGKVIDISPLTQVSDKFRKREFVIEKKESGQSGLFIDYIKFQLTQDRCDIINESFMNEEVKVTFNIKGNRWERDGKVSYFTNLDAWKIERVNAGAPARSSNPAEETSPQSFDDAQSINDLDDLPF
ncbi:MAG TPA: DUF3127 domain-containing protein [Bacteroidales bacterium]|nr:DUF3127 domain-containing protein [Bacteroidales bacterium]